MTAHPPEVVELVARLRQMAKSTFAIGSEKNMLSRAADTIERLSALAPQPGEVELREALEKIASMTDADDPESYRADDREGCLDAVHATARAALKEVKS